MAPGNVLVVEGAGFGAAVEDADEPVRQPSQGVVVPVAGSALPVVERAGPGRRAQGREGLSVEGVDEPVVVHEPGHDDLLLARRAGDGAGGGVVAAGPAVAAAVRVIAGFCEHPGAEDGSDPGLG